MARLNSVHHFRRHQFVNLLFDDTGFQILFTLLPLSHQYELYEYYAIGGLLDEATFQGHRHALDKLHPSLAHRAGKHYKVLERAFADLSAAQGFTRWQMKRAVAVHNAKSRRPPTRTDASKPKRGRPASSSAVRVLPVGKPLDARQLAKALLMLADHQIRDASSPSSDPSDTSVQDESATSRSDVA